MLEPRLISVGIPQPIEAPFVDKTVKAGVVVTSRLPKADNTSMAGGRGLLQWYQSHRFAYASRHDFRIINV